MRILAWATLTATALAAADTDRWDFDFGFSGINTFAHLPHVKCLTHPEESFDIGIIGAPFDTAVSYRPGERRCAVQFQLSNQGLALVLAPSGPTANVKPRFEASTPKPVSTLTTTGPKLYEPPLPLENTRLTLKIDCGDIPITPMDNAVALHEMDEAYAQLAESPRANVHPDAPKTPRLITLGGDHSIVW